MLRETIFYLLIVVAGTGGELCVTRAMKTIGEVTDFRPMSLFRVVFRAMKVGWMWIGLGQMTLAFFALLGMLSLENVSLVIPVTALSYAFGALGRKILPWRARHAAALGRGAAGLRRRHAGVHRQRITRAGGHGDSRCASVAGRSRPSLTTSRHLSRPRAFFAARLPAAPNFSPPISILKPIRGLDRETYENYASFCRQDYPEFEILFCVADADDPAIPIIQKIIPDFPQRSVRLLVGSEPLGVSDKVNKLCRMVREAQHDIVLVSDSDVRVEPGFLRKMAAPFRDPEVGGVTCLYRGLDRWLACLRSGSAGQQH